MKADPIRVKSYLSEIRRNSIALQQLLDQNELIPDSVPLKATKYGSWRKSRLSSTQSVASRHDFM